MIIKIAVLKTVVRYQTMHNNLPLLVLRLKKVKSIKKETFQISQTPMTRLNP